ncbi:hypothetical protein B0H17DRAFT_955263 [Mycena rosella]|uniref:Uncharacterized protein n=1 Tax=Mycena rosella TaxID=1033263 RepID=A0AAD7CT48_MYCRO|nr:hypothetical protein B0H17DRAFT_955263 [Mycena rosella]
MWPDSSLLRRPVRRSPTPSPSCRLVRRSPTPSPSCRPVRRSPTPSPPRRPVQRSPTPSPPRRPVRRSPTPSPPRRPVQRSPTPSPPRRPVRRSPTPSPPRRPVRQSLTPSPPRRPLRRSPTPSSPHAPRLGRANEPVVLIRAWTQDGIAPIKVFLPLEHGFLQLDDHKLLLGKHQLECGTALERFVGGAEGGFWEDLGWSVSGYIGEGTQMGVRRKNVIEMKNWELHEGKLDV